MERSVLVFQRDIYIYRLRTVRTTLGDVKRNQNVCIFLKEDFRVKFINIVVIRIKLINRKNDY